MCLWNACAYDVFARPTIRDVNGTELSAGAVANPYLFTGRRYDAEEGLYYYRARYYDFATARFLQPDPTGYVDGLNMYAYVGNSPLNWGDPLGLCKSESALQQSAFGRALLGLSGFGIGFGEAVTGFLKGAAYTALHPWTLSPTYQLAHARETAGHIYDAIRQFGADIASPDAERNGQAIGRLTGNIFNVGAATGVTAGIREGLAGTSRGFTSRMSPGEARRYQQYWEGLTGHAPEQGAPYSLRNTYAPSGQLKSVTTYDRIGNRAFQYEIGPGVRHGQGYHSYTHTGKQISVGKGPRSGHVDF
jgi:RHS repeat-associated protein